MRSAVVDVCEFMHRSVQDMCPRFDREMRMSVYVTPTSYLELITTFKTLIGSKREEISGLKRRYDVGLDQLKKTEDEVPAMHPLCICNACVDPAVCSLMCTLKNQRQQHRSIFAPPTTPTAILPSPAPTATATTATATTTVRPTDNTGGNTTTTTKTSPNTSTTGAVCVCLC